MPSGPIRKPLLYPSELQAHKARGTTKRELSAWLVVGIGATSRLGIVDQGINRLKSCQRKFPGSTFRLWLPIGVSAAGLGYSPGGDHEKHYGDIPANDYKVEDGYLTHAHLASQKVAPIWLDVPPAAGT